jgi:hypothetical protein
MLDRTRSLCENFSLLPSPFSDARCFVPVRLRHWDSRRRSPSLFTMMLPAQSSRSTSWTNIIQRKLCNRLRGFEDRSKTALRGYDCRGTRPRALALEVLAFCQGSARCCGRSEIPAANTSGETSRSRAREQLRVQKTSCVRSLSGASRRSVSLWRQARGWPR